MQLHDAVDDGVHASEHIPYPSVHVHLRAQEGVYALYATPLPLRLCVDIIREYLDERHLLLLSPVEMHPLEEQGVPVHTVRSSFLLVAARDMHYLAHLMQPHLAFADTSLLPEQLESLSIEQLIVDTFVSPMWHLTIHPAIGNLLYGEIRDGCCTHLLSKERSLLTDVLSQFLRAYMQQCLPDLSAPKDFPPLIHEQLWQYAAQGLAPLGVERTPDGAEFRVALGTPDPRACATAPACTHVSQIQRGFILRWHGGGWDLCSTEEWQI